MEFLLQLYEKVALLLTNLGEYRPAEEGTLGSRVKLPFPGSGNEQPHCGSWLANRYPVGGTTPMSLRATQVGFRGLFLTKENMKLGQGGGYTWEA